MCFCINLNKDLTFYSFFLYIWENDLAKIYLSKFMKSVYKSRFMYIEYDEANSMMLSHWDNSDQMAEDDFRSEMIVYKDFAFTHKVQNYLVDNRIMYFAISPALQVWVNENIFPFTMHPQAKKFAIVMPEDFIAQIALEQTIEEGEKTIGAVQTLYFDTLDKAQNWILGN